MLKLPRHVARYDWDRGGEDGDFWARSVKSESTTSNLMTYPAGLLFPDVLRQKPEKAKLWQTDLLSFSGWKERDDEV
jgi:hypothetical protein